MSEAFGLGAPESSQLNAVQPQSVVGQFLNEQAERGSTIGSFFGLSGEKSITTAADDMVVAEELATLGHGWSVLRMPRSTDEGAEQSRVVIGPPGVFLVIVENFARRAVWIDDHSLILDTDRMSVVTDLRHEAQLVADTLAAAGIPATVTPVIAIADALSITFGAESSALVALRVDRLARWLSQRRQTETPESIRRIQAVLESRVIGDAGRPVVDDTITLMDSLDETRRSFTQGRKRLLRAFEIAVVVALVAGVVAAVALILPLITG